mgnify:CR=1 FL=1|tara:strand:+ start:226 stop:996 length:771 start_codon:yes stop_codon:yes gene_type:complete
MDNKKELLDESLADFEIDPDVLAKELAVELEVDPLEEIDNDNFSNSKSDASAECDQALDFLKGTREERIQGLKIFCEYRDNRSFPLLIPLLNQPCPVERMSAVYALGRNPCPEAVEKLVHLLESDDNAYVRRATAWSLANYDNQVVLKPLINALKNDVSSVRLWASSSLAEIGSTSTENAELAANQLLISLKIDNETVVRSNCIWSLCRLYQVLSDPLQEQFVDECTKIALFDSEPSLMEEAKTALDSMGMKGFYN